MGAVERAFRRTGCIMVVFILDSYVVLVGMSPRELVELV